MTISPGRSRTSEPQSVGGTWQKKVSERRGERLYVVKRQ